MYKQDFLIYTYFKNGLYRHHTNDCEITNSEIMSIKDNGCIKNSLLYFMNTAYSKFKYDIYFKLQSELTMKKVNLRSYV